MLAFTSALSILAGLVFGAVPILRYGRPDVTSALKDAGHGATTGHERPRTRTVLVASQVALALTLLIGAALMAQSFWRLRHVDAGFESKGVLTFELTIPTNVYRNDSQRSAFWNALLERIRALPGVDAAGAASGLPLTGFRWSLDEPLVAGNDPVAANDVAPTGFLRSLLFEVSPTDPATFAGVTLFLAAIALLPCWIPARHAAKVDPMAALRAE